MLLSSAISGAKLQFWEPLGLRTLHMSVLQHLWCHTVKSLKHQAGVWACSEHSHGLCALESSVCFASNSCNMPAKCSSDVHEVIAVNAVCKMLLCQEHPQLVGCEWLYAVTKKLWLNWTANVLCILCTTVAVWDACFRMLRDRNGMSMCLCSTRSPCELEYSLDVVCWLLTAVPVQLLSSSLLVTGLALLNNLGRGDVPWLSLRWGSGAGWCGCQWGCDGVEVRSSGRMGPSLLQDGPAGLDHSTV